MNKYQLVTIFAFTAAAAGAQTPAPAPQHPSPMQERTRRHERLEQTRGADLGVNLTLDSLLPRTVEILIPQRALTADSAPLLIHFMGATWLPKRAAAQFARPVVVAAVYLGAGSAVYSRPFADDTLLYGRLVDSILARVAQVTSAPRITGIYLSGFSAGYGAIREIVRRPHHLPRVDGALLLDGLHAGYVPERTPLADGGVIDTAALAPFAAFARLAVEGKKRFVVTHSEIFPGTFASTTECADWLLDALRLARTPVLEWGPLGMQQLSLTAAGRFALLGFAGNSGPDHIDHFHGLGTFLERLLAP
jgi:hypothetical protein